MARSLSGAFWKERSGRNQNPEGKRPCARQGQAPLSLYRDTRSGSAGEAHGLEQNRRSELRATNSFIVFFVKFCILVTANRT
jgi:hypothetical protein